MELIKIFKHSIALPKKQAVFWLNRVSMRDTLVYIFLLIFVLYLPEGYALAFQKNLLLDSDLRSVFILQSITFYPMYVIFTGLVVISALAAGALLMARLLHRKLAFQHLWKMTAFALTLPLIIYTAIKLTGWGNGYLVLLLLVGLYLILYKMITVYPKRKKQSSR
ncbi:DUF1189 domain-containing protein [Sediminibacillus dalangtanensis]|uniref:DUF1189 domain-containing protein n=1 Tax=Sediminibacillus dalangtanensis TaxID=2729421 RepID=A0ABX7VQQ1_9BACI|nr:DUF1189 family protein [Sediminibacillus dalangtanensis]QTM98823.1 DUF1189 domain-containing protein [Sediminibacillus dalangtanensis]